MIVKITLAIPFQSLGEEKIGVKLHTAIIKFDSACEVPDPYRTQLRHIEWGPEEDTFDSKV